jgi:hypothetical protein
MKNPKPKPTAQAITVSSYVSGVLSATMIHNDVQRRAHELYCERGSEHGHDMDHWLQAEREVRSAVNIGV